MLKAATSFATSARGRWPRFGRGGLELIYPPGCISCETATVEAHGLCAACWAAMPFVTRPYCERLGVPFAADLGPGLLSPAAIADPPAFGRGRAAVLYEGPARTLVLKLKFGDRLELARPLARHMVRAGAELLSGTPLLVPVPLHWTRLWRRRYNQAGELARWIGRESGHEVAYDLLARARRTRSQIGLSAAERAKNLNGALKVTPKGRLMLAGRRVIVIDDVRTSGATANACAHILRRAGAAEIDVLTFALADHSLDPIV